jgi:hypothetical protein
MKYKEISYEDCERRGYSSGVEIEGVGRFYSKIEEALSIGLWTMMVL